jgi:PKD repeat protein
MGGVIAQENGSMLASTVSGLGVGTYSVSINGNAGCGMITQSIDVEQPLAFDVTANMSPATCAIASNGGVDITTNGGTAPYAYAWSNGGGSEDLVGVPSGSYDVTITDAHGCQQQLIDQVVTAGAGPEAAFIPSTATPNVGEEVEFFNFSTYGISYSWDFGDGATSTGNEPMHGYAAGGTYTVHLTAADGACNAEFTMDIVVLGSTGVTTTGPDAPLSAWSDAHGFIVEWTDLGGDDVLAEVIDAEGKVVATASAHAGVGSVRIAGEDLSVGSYVIRVTQGDEQRAFKLSLLR